MMGMAARSASQPSRKCRECAEAARELTVSRARYAVSSPLEAPATQADSKHAVQNSTASEGASGFSLKPEQGQIA